MSPYRTGSLLKLVLFLPLMLWPVEVRLDAAAITSIWIDGNGDWNSGGNWNNGVPNNGGGNTFSAVISNGSTVSLDINATINNLTVGALNGLSVNSGLTLTVNGSGVAGAGSISNNGTIALNAVNSNTFLRLAGGGNVTLSGTGTLLMPIGASQVIGDGSTGLINSAGHTIQGTGGSIGTGANIAITNQGTINAGINSLRLMTSNGTNTGLIQAQAGGGELILANSTFSNVGGTFLTNGSGAGTLLESSTINGGNVTISGNGTLFMLSSTVHGGSTLTNSSTGTISVNGPNNVIGGTLNNSAGGMLTIADGATLTLESTGTHNNNGTMSLNSTGAVTKLLLAWGGAVSLTGNGTLSLSNNGANQVFSNDNTALVNGVAHTIQGSGQIGMGQTKITNNGTMLANQNIPLVINADAGGFNNTGTLTVRAGSLMLVTAPVNGFLNYDSATHTLTGGTYNVFGMLASAGNLQFDNADIVTNAANILLDGMQSNIIDRNGLDGLRDIAANSGSFTIQNGRALNTPGAFADTGTVTIGSGSTFSVNGGAGTYTESTGSATTEVNGTLQAALVDVRAGATLRGSGTVAGNVQNAGTVSPGNSPGALTISGNYTQFAQGIFMAELGGVIPGLYDQLFIGGNASLNGAIDVVLFDGFQPNAGDFFKLMTFTNENGDFSARMFPTLAGGLSFREILRGQELDLEVVGPGVPEPSTLLLALAGLAAIAFRGLRGGRL